MKKVKQKDIDFFSESVNNKIKESRKRRTYSNSYESPLFGTLPLAKPSSFKNKNSSNLLKSLENQPRAGIYQDYRNNEKCIY